jgi:hypothetical protein
MVNSVTEQALSRLLKLVVDGEADITPSLCRSSYVSLTRTFGAAVYSESHGFDLPVQYTP